MCCKYIFTLVVSYIFTWLLTLTYLIDSSVTLAIITCCPYQKSYKFLCSHCNNSNTISVTMKVVLLHKALVNNFGNLAKLTRQFTVCIVWIFYMSKWYCTYHIVMLMLRNLLRLVEYFQVTHQVSMNHKHLVDFHNVPQNMLQSFVKCSV